MTLVVVKVTDPESDGRVSETHIQTFPQVVKEFQAFYAKFCGTVLGGLIEADKEQAARTRRQFLRDRATRKLSEEEFPGTPKEPEAESE